MRHLNCLFTAVILNILSTVLPGGCNRFPTLPDNCTCETSHGTYSLFPLRRTGGKPRFYASGFPPHKGYTYTYNPCVPYNLTSTEGKCTNVALCKYNTEGDPPVYSDIGEQRDVQCDISDGQISLIYPVHNKDISIHESKVILKCSNNSQFSLTNEDYMIFTLTSICGCPNGCSPTKPTTGPLPKPTTGPLPKPTTTPLPKPTTGPIPTKASATPSSGHKGKDWYSNWELVILLPSLLAFFVVVMGFVCLWRRLSVIQGAILFRCCHCNENMEPGISERLLGDATETSSLIKNQADNRAIEHEDVLAKGKIREPVQVEDRDVEEDYKFRGKSDRKVVV